MQNIISYLKNPIYNKDNKFKIKYFLFLFFIYIIAAISLGIIGSIISKLFNIKHIEIGLTPLMTFLVGGILAPIYEEIIFRSLLKFKNINILLFIIALAIFLGIGIYKAKIMYVLIVSILLFSILSLVFIFSRGKIELFISSKFKYFFYATVLSFGLIHLFNFTGNIYLIMAFSFFLIGPQLVLGCILGYIRMNYGLIYSIIFHMILNSLMLISFSH